VRLITQDSTKCELHPGSVGNQLQDVNGKYAVYHKLMRTANVSRTDRFSYNVYIDKAWLTGLDSFL